MARQVEFVYCSALPWNNYGTPRVAISVYGPRGGERGGGEMTLEEAESLREQLDRAINNIKKESS